MEEGDIEFNNREEEQHEQQPRRAKRELKKKPSWTCDRNTCNKITAKVIPVLLCGAAGYATWVYIAQVCINFLMFEHHNRGLAAGLITIYFILFLLMASSFFRIILAGPGYVPLGKEDIEKSAGPDPTASADMFVCEAGGYPRWCRVCEAIKPDRAHHSSIAGRCTYKMDHFCPWVGGMVGFSRYKFFFQFVTYVSLYCIFVIAGTAPFLPQRISDDATDSDFPKTWVVLLVLGAFFGVFMTPFSITNVYYISKNITTNESFDHKHRTYLFNILLTDEDTAPSTSQRAIAPQNPSSSARVVVTTDPGDPHPWDLGCRRNWTQLMGDKWYDWFLPIHRSPGDGVRFEYNEELVKKLKARARVILQNQGGMQGARNGTILPGTRLQS